MSTATSTTTDVVSEEEWGEDEEGEDWGEQEGGEEWGDDDGKEGWGDFTEVDDENLPDMMANMTERAVSYLFVDAQIISDRKELAILTASEQLDVTPSEAGCILRAYFWDLTKATEAWYENRESVRKKIGVSAPLKPSGLPQEIQCSTFMCDEVPRSQANALGCGHWFCNECWEQHCMACLEDGQGAIYATCPGFSCKKKKCKHKSQDNCKCQELLPEDYFYKYVKDKKSIQNYAKYMRNAFVEKNKQIKWCPRPGCNYCVEYTSGTERDIRCKCGHTFCFACSLDAHLPVPCDLAIKFLQLETGDALTEALLKAITKPCPGCKVRIQKNEACIHMTCKNCRHEFCWLCMKNWKGHGGGYYSCKKYNKNKADGKLDKETQTVVKNQKMMQKYSTYSEAYNKAKKKAASVTKVVLSTEENEDAEKSKFLVDALSSLITGYRSLQWSYCLTYFLKAGPTKRLFLFQQKDLAKICNTQFELFGNGKKFAIDLTKEKENIVKGARTVRNLVKACNESVGTMLEEIQNDADGENDQWTCMACKHTMDNKEALNCTKCNACQEHGDKPCWGCNPR